MPSGECFQTFLSHGWLLVEDHSIVVDSGDASDFLKLVYVIFVEKIMLTPIVLSLQLICSVLYS
jgi:hypothetical protein